MRPLVLLGYAKRQDEARRKARALASQARIVNGQPYFWHLGQYQVLRPP